MDTEFTPTPAGTPTPLPIYAPPPPRGTGLRMAIILILIAFAAGLAAMAYAATRYPHWFGIQATAATAAITAEPDAPAPVLVPPPPEQRLMSETMARETALAGRIAELEARLSDVGVRARAASGNATRAEGLLIAFAARRALDRGRGLGYLEGQLRERFGERQLQAVNIVIQAARYPVTLEELQIGLDEIAPELSTGSSATTWWAGVRRELTNLVVIRREGSPSPRAADRLARARRKLEGGQVDSALAEVTRMPGAAKGQAWVAAARRYNEARRALDVIETAAITEPQDVAATTPEPPIAPPPLSQGDIAPTLN